MEAVVVLVKEENRKRTKPKGVVEWGEVCYSFPFASELSPFNQQFNNSTTTDKHVSFLPPTTYPILSIPSLLLAQHVLSSIFVNNDSVSRATYVLPCSRFSSIDSTTALARSSTRTSSLLAYNVDDVFYRMRHFRPLPSLLLPCFLLNSAERVACSKTSRTPSLALAEHSR